MQTIGGEVGKLLDAYKNGVLDKATATERIGEKFQLLGQNQSLALQAESVKIGRIGTELQAEQNTILKETNKLLGEVLRSRNEAAD